MVFPDVVGHIVDMVAGHNVLTIFSVSTGGTVFTVLTFFPTVKFTVILNVFKYNRLYTVYNILFYCSIYNFFTTIK